MTARMPDPRGVRVSAVGADAHVPALVLEPPAVPVVPVAHVGGEGILGGAAPVPPPPVREAGVGTPGAVLVDGEPRSAELIQLDGERYILRLRDGDLVADGDPAGAPRESSVRLLPPADSPGLALGTTRREVIVDGWRVEVDVEAAARAALRERARRGREEATHSGPSEVRAIIPGVVVGVTAIPGDAVVAGQQLLVVEAMKMQNELRAPRDGTVERVAVGPGSRIEVGDLLLVIS